MSSREGVISVRFEGFFGHSSWYGSLFVQVKDDFKEASSAPDVILRKKLQTQTLAAMFETYFGVLKSSLEPPDEKYASP